MTDIKWSQKAKHEPKAQLSWKSKEKSLDFMALRKPEVIHLPYLKNYICVFQTHYKCYYFGKKA